MPVINSQNAVKEATPQVQQPPQTPTLRSGETVATSLEGAKDGKVYYHRIPNAKFIMPNGLEVMFLAGQFRTSDPELMAELDKVVDRPSSMIYTKSEAMVAAAQLAAQAAAEAAENAHSN